jgi:hypothetical protein
MTWHCVCAALIPAAWLRRSPPPAAGLPARRVRLDAALALGECARECGSERALIELINFMR